MHGIYSVTGSFSVTAAQTLIQLKAGASSIIEIQRAWVTQSDVIADDNMEIQILRNSTASTVTSFTPSPFEVGDQAAAAVGGVSATGIDASAEGTPGNILVREGASVLAGFTWLPVPNEMIYIPPGGFLSLKSAIDITAATLVCGITFREIG